ncbi:MAG TPA: hypothetical protein VLM38_00160 [Blastocatellia bacterium]|nr:hypothetical protein [Blastocatellia bacterium]
MTTRTLWLVSGLLIVLCARSVSAQGTHEFLGSPREVPDQYTVKYGIRYNTQGYDQPEANWKKKLKKWTNKSVPGSAIEEIMAFPGSPDAIGQWIDDAFDKTLAQFSACDDSLARRANRMKAGNLYVKIMPSAFYVPVYNVLAAGAYYPTEQEIRVLNIYYTWSGENRGWMRHARDLLVYEMGNYFAVALGIQPEPRQQGWPCNAPVVGGPQQ